MATLTEPEQVDLVAYSLVVDPETDQILIVGYRGGGWSLPGGAREPGETLAETAKRETMEETGVVVAVERLMAINERLPNPRSPNHHAVFFTFFARIIDGTPAVTGDEEIVRVKWVDAEEANRLMPYWQLDFTLHEEYQAFYHAAQWDDRD